MWLAWLQFASATGFGSVRMGSKQWTQNIASKVFAAVVLARGGPVLGICKEYISLCYQLRTPRLAYDASIRVGCRLHPRWPLYPPLTFRLGPERRRDVL